MNGSEGTLMAVAEVASVEHSADGVTGVVRIGGARMRVALDFVPGVGVGDAVLVHAGVALAWWRDDRRESAPCV